MRSWGSPAGCHAVHFQVFDQLAVHYVGGQQQGQLAQLGEHAGIRAVGPAGAVEQRIGRHVHHFDLVGLAQESLGDAIRGALSGEALDIELLLADVLQVDRGDDGDAAIEQVFDILPALRIAAAGRIVVSQLVDQADRRVAAEERRQIDHFVSLAAVALLDRRDHFETRQHALDIGFVGGLHQADHHILAALFAAAAFVEHAVSLAYARGITQKDFETAAPLAPFGVLDAAQEFLGTRFVLRAGSHVFRILMEGHRRPVSQVCAGAFRSCGRIGTEGQRYGDAGSRQTASEDKG